MYDEILTMMILQQFVDVMATPTFTAIKCYHNTITHTEMMLADLEKIGRERDIKIETSEPYTPLLNDCFSEDDTHGIDVSFYDNDGFVKICIEIYYH